MLFNSVQFLIFFPVVTLLYFALPHRFRWMLLLAASCIFYMCFVPAYILILAVLIVVDYFAGICLENFTGKKRKFFLLISIFSACIALFVFKYFNFFSGIFNWFASFFDLTYRQSYLKILLPIGLSFHTFQSLSYVIEVYRGTQKAERNFGIFALYVMFYPQLVAGPIERPAHLLHQFYEEHTFEYQRVLSGLKLMAWGMFKKVVIADRLALLVNQVYSGPALYQGPDLITATVFFAFQIYCDFSGYTDIAIGSANVMGFKLVQNFNRPYFSRSVSEFWRRWHISLSTWFRDYVYVPLGGNRVPALRHYYNLFITFLISGLWHGANWTFVIWGIVNWFYVLCDIVAAPLRNIIKIRFWPEKLGFILNLPLVLLTFLLTCFAWIFFRANNLKDACYIITHLTSGFTQTERPSFLPFPGLSNMEFILAVSLVGLLVAVESLQKHGQITDILNSKPVYVRWTFYYLLLITMVTFGVFGKNQFIYFQF